MGTNCGTFKHELPVLQIRYAGALKILCAFHFLLLSITWRVSGTELQLNCPEVLNLRLNCIISGAARSVFVPGGQSVHCSQFVRSGVLAI